MINTALVHLPNLIHLMSQNFINANCYQNDLDLFCLPRYILWADLMTFSFVPGFFVYLNFLFPLEASKLDSSQALYTCYFTAPGEWFKLLFSS